MKVYQAINTLLRDEELPFALETAKYACEIGVDALIVQDVGLASLLHQMAPEMRLHASTQMSVHTLAGVQLLAEMGFRRVVLSRELSLEEIREIAHLMALVAKDFEGNKAAVRAAVDALCDKYPLYE